MKVLMVEPGKSPYETEIAGEIIAVKQPITNERQKKAPNPSHSGPEL